MTLTGMIQHCGAAGLYSFSPPLLRSVHKLSAVADKHMRSVRAQKVGCLRKLKIIGGTFFISAKYIEANAN